MIRIVLAALLFVLPCHFALAQSVDEQNYRQTEAFQYRANDSTTVDVNVLSDSSGNPIFYVSHLTTGVCSDGLCKPVDINIYWDLLGDFYEYQTSNDYPLTKFDHIELTKEDHTRLHEILSDTSSILRDYRVEDMIDTTVHVKSGVLDAITGATNPTFDGATVEGALYTVYTLWHFVNGSVRRKIYEHTESLLSNSLITHMLRSGNRDYENFIFSNISDSQRKEFASDIIALIPSKDLYTPHFAIAQLTDEVLADSSSQLLVLGYFNTVSPVVQNSLLARVETIKLKSASMLLLLEAVPELSSNQLDKVFSIIENNKTSIDNKAMEKLNALSAQQGKAFAHYAQRVISKVGHIQQTP